MLIKESLVLGLLAPLQRFTSSQGSAALAEGCLQLFPLVWLFQRGKKMVNKH